jgi:GNAT superfamily N-acetyltransferase
VLASALTVAFVPSTDLDRSRRFYEGILGLPVVEQDGFAVVLDAVRLTIRVTYVGPHVTVQPFTVLGWEVGDIRADMAGLVERGVAFLRVDTVDQDEAGVWTAPDGTQVAWFKDPDGNTLSLSQRTPRMSTIRVRDAAAHDEPVLARIFREASLSNADDRDALLAHPETLSLSADVLARGRTRVATVADGTVVGFATTRPTDPGVLELDDLFVDPGAMRTGVARHLILRIATEAQGEGVARIDVTANPHARGFYDAVGFVLGPRVDTEFGPAQRMHLDVAGFVRAADPS